VAEERAALEKRKQAAEESKANRIKASEETTEVEDTSVLDSLLEKLRNGDTVPRRARRRRPSADNSNANLSLDLSLPRPAVDTADVARDMLARLQSDGFATTMPVSPTSTSFAPRRRRRRLELSSINDEDGELGEIDGLGTPLTDGEAPSEALQFDTPQTAEGPDT
jgi:cytokinesis protein